MYWYPLQKVMRKVLVHQSLPEEQIDNVRFLYIVIDSELNVHYEFNNKGHVISPFNLNEINPGKIYRNLPQNLIAKSTLQHKKIIGVLQLWIYYTKDYSYGHIRGLGILQQYRGNLRIMGKLISAMDSFCKAYHLSFVETITSVISPVIMEKYGFKRGLVRGTLHRIGALITGQKMFVKEYANH